MFIELREKYGCMFQKFCITPEKKRKNRQHQLDRNRKKIIVGSDIQLCFGLLFFNMNSAIDSNLFFLCSMPRFLYFLFTSHDMSRL